MQEAKHKWVYLIGDGLTHVRLKYFVNVLNDSLYSYREDYEMRHVLSGALKQVILGVGDLHGGGFAILNCIYTVFYGGFLQAFQAALGWKRIKGSDVAKTYQQCSSLVDMVYNEVLRGLHYKHAAQYVKSDNDVRNNDTNPASFAIEMVIDFDRYLDDLLLSSSDQAMCMYINFVRLVSQYKFFKEAVTAGDCITVEKIYSDFIPVFMHLGKHNYHNILLDQTDEYYHRIPYHVLQWIRENRFPKLYDGTDRKNNKLSHWAIDALMELMSKNVTELDFPNSIEAW